MCGGKDRFRFDNLEGRGTWFCSKCGAGDGIELVKRSRGLEFREAAKEIEAVIGQAVQAPPTARDAGGDLAAMQALWRSSSRVQAGDPVSRYLSRRLGLDIVPPCIRIVSAHAYRDDGVLRGYWPVMLAHVTGPDGQGVNLHRTYLTHEGDKAPVPKVRKVMAGSLPDGLAVRLMPAGETLGIAEGIETAFAAARLFGLPVWAALNDNRLEVWKPPAGVREVVIFGDNDENMAGQSAAFGLARKLKAKGLAVRVEIPPQVDTDWADSWQTRNNFNDLSE